MAKSGCRILTPTGQGTGFLMGANRLMTNNHGIATPEIAKQSFAEFNYEQDGEGGHLPTYRFRLNPAIFHTSPINQLDYTIVGIDADPNVGELGQWGRLTLNPNAKPVTTEQAIIIQHPNGGLKQITMTANHKSPSLSGVVAGSGRQI